MLIKKNKGHFFHNIIYLLMLPSQKNVGQVNVNCFVLTNILSHTPVEMIKVLILKILLILIQKMKAFILFIYRRQYFSLLTLIMNKFSLFSYLPGFILL